MDCSEKKIAAVFKALGDENRIRILKMMRNGEICACKLLEELSIGQPTLSHHMKILCDVGIVHPRRAGKWVYYSINCEGICEIRKMLQEVMAPKNQPANCKCTEESGQK